MKTTLEQSWQLAALRPQLSEMMYEAEEIIKDVSEHLKADIALMYSTTRKRHIVAARYICYYIFWHKFDMENNQTKKKRINFTTDIATSFFGQDHATFLHGVETISNLLEVDKYFSAEVMPIINKYKTK